MKASRFFLKQIRIVLFLCLAPTFATQHCLACEKYAPVAIDEIIFGIRAFEKELLSSYAPLQWKSKRHGYCPSQAASFLIQNLEERQAKDPAACLPFEEMKRQYLALSMAANDLHLQVLFDDSRVALLPIHFAIKQEEELSIIVESTKEAFYLQDQKEIEKVLPGDTLLLIEGMAPLQYLVSQSLALPLRAQKRPAAELERCFTKISFRVGKTAPLPREKEPISLTFQRGASQYNVMLHFCIQPLPKEKSPAVSPLSIKDLTLKQARASKKWSDSIEHIPQIPGRYLTLISLKSFQSPSTEDFCSFLQHLDRARKEADAILIDLEGNRGGSELMMLLYLALLIDQPISMPIKLCNINEWIQNQMAIRAQALKSLLQQIESPQTRLNCFPTVSLMPLRPIIEGIYLQDCRIAALFQSKNKPSTQIATFVSGRSKLMPIHPSWTAHPIEEKDQIPQLCPPLVIYRDGLCGSAAELFATILYDNKLAALTGTKSGGAGGEVRALEFSPHRGLSRIFITSSLLVRWPCDGENSIFEEEGI